jgi:alpha-glucosidase/alpha-D-xyloside xylohydrolase
MALGTANLLLSRTLHSAPGVPAVGNDRLLTVAAFSERTLRIRIIQQGKQGPANETGIVQRDWPEPLSLNDNVIRWSNYKLEVTERPWSLSITDTAGKIRQSIKLDPHVGAMHFSLGEGPVFGLGEGVHPFNRRGTANPMRNGQLSPDLSTFGARVPIPWLIGTSGWGVFIAHPWGTFDLSGTEGRFLPTEETPTRDIFLMLIDKPAEMLREWAELTGYPYMPPLWSLGYQQSHRTLLSREAVLDEVKQFRQRKLPCDTMIYLGTGFCPAGWNMGQGSFVFNPAIFPDPAAMVQEIHDQHMKVILHMTEPPEDLHGEVGDTGAALEDPSNAAVYWAKHKEVLSTGVDGWWPDEGDELKPASRLSRNRMYWEGSQLFQPNVRPFALHRNGYAGIQRYGWLWSGDTLSTWKTLAAQVMIGINAGLCGIPYWGTDTGGFVPTKEFTAELFVRWFQFSAFCPSFRCHGRTWMLRLPWGWDLGNYGPAEMQDTTILPKPEDLHNRAVEEICRKYLNLRYQLLPYLYSAVAVTHRTGLPLMRALWLAYPDDAKATLTDDAYLWGDSILVSPVVEAGATHRSTYLPIGLWWDYWTGVRIDGGRQVSREVTLEAMPLYVKAGSVIPHGPIKQYTEESSNEPLVLRIYPGADGTSSLYEDDGISLDHERGEFTRLDLAWDDQTRTLTWKADEHGKPTQEKTVLVELVGTSRTKHTMLSSSNGSVKL